MTFICYVLIGVLLSIGTFGIPLQSIGLAMIKESLLYWIILPIAALTVLTAVQYTYDNAGVFRLVVRRYFYKRSQQELS
jgi:hypothetical protein